MRYKIDRFIHTHKTITIAVVTSLILSQLCLSCTTEDKSTHYLKMVGSCQQTTSVKIFDETGGIDPYGQPINTINNQHFKNYVNIISKHIFAKIDKMNQCQGNSKENPQVELVFIYRPAISRGISPYNDSPTKFWDNRYLDSPWVKLSLDKSPKLNMRAVFVWNERQFLYDQAIIKARRVLDTKPLLPIDRGTVEEWAWEYTFAERDEKAKVAKKLQLPADILWLFKYVHMQGLGHGPREVPINSLSSIDNQEKLGYTDLVEVILNRFLAESKTDIRYDNILDLKDVFNIDEYRIYPYTDEESFKYYKSSP